MTTLPFDDARLARRTFLLTASAFVGQLAIGFGTVDAATSPEIGFKPDQFLRIDRTGAITLVVPYAEMGQGALTGAAMLVAEELEVDVSTIQTELAPGDDKLYGSSLFGDQITGGSASIRAGWKTMRQVGAAARIMLVEAAARSWSVDPSTCRAELGWVLHPETKRRTRYGDLVDRARVIPVPQNPLLRTTGLKVIGKPQRRLDTPSKVNGSAKFGFDVQLPGMRHAAAMSCPVIGGRLASVDEAPALAVSGVRQVVRLDNAVAVVADHGGAARKGLAALDPQWTGGSTHSTADLIASFDAALDHQGLVAEKKGDVAVARKTATSSFEATYRLPMLAHAAMEPLNCAVSVTRNFCEVWVGSQVPGRARKAAAEASGLPIEQVRVNSHFIGGGFGRRLEHDWVIQAVRIGRIVGAPVKVMWSREEDMRQDAYRFHNHSRVRVGLDAKGMPISFEHRLVAPGVMFRFLPGFTKDGIDLDAVDDAASPYAIPNTRVEFVRQEPPEGLLVGNWRGVGATRNAVIVEGVIDEIALRANMDPVAYRRALLEPRSRLSGAFERVVADSGWTLPLPRGSGRGVAVVSAFGSHVAMVAEVTRQESGAFRVTRIFCAIDTGHVVNPVLVRQQIEGGIVYGLSAVLYGRITLDQGRVVESNFHDYRVLRMNEMPEIFVSLIQSSEDPGGVGEPGTALVAPAVLNAIRAAGGPRVTTLPLDPTLVVRL
ncbi:molybdopterin cofactor-binding domain-containing protein [Sphingomonas arantia]|uniref:Molybdopterin cofactor-binding domain-containing protein n=1 Tax=Sphingomonas arantia TaxID=1460676 RepID=A0ABW4TYH5_9SPHN